MITFGGTALYVVVIALSSLFWRQVVPVGMLRVGLGDRSLNEGNAGDCNDQPWECSLGWPGSPKWSKQKKQKALEAWVTRSTNAGVHSWPSFFAFCEAGQCSVVVVVVVVVVMRRRSCIVLYKKRLDGLRFWVTCGVYPSIYSIRRLPRQTRTFQSSTSLN
jgi:hypothetical protein